MPARSLPSAPASGACGASATCWVMGTVWIRYGSVRCLSSYLFVYIHGISLFMDGLFIEMLFR